LTRTTPQDATLALPARDAVCIEALEQELCVAAARAGEVAEAGQRDLPCPLALAHDQIDGDGVAAGTDRIAAAEPDQHATRFEEPSQLGVLHLDRCDSRGGKLPLEFRGLRRPRTQHASRTGLVEERATTLQPEQRDDFGSPGITGDRHSGIEWVGSRDATA
jgi:hypothetical protein